jgi:MFS family permease
MARQIPDTPTDVFCRVPISTSFGRRPVFLLSQLINFGANIWRAKANSYGSFMGACIVNGIGAGPAETIMPQVIADIFFLHDRGKWNTLYWYVRPLIIWEIIQTDKSLQGCLHGQLFDI